MSCGTEHLLLSLLKETDCVATRLLFTMGVNIQKLFAAILTAMGFDNDTIAEEFQYARNAGNKKMTSTPTLDQYSRDLTQLAAEGKLDPVIGRDNSSSWSKSSSVIAQSFVRALSVSSI